MSFESLLESLQGRPVAAEILADFVPPPRFAGKTFEEYHPRHPTQSAAVERLARLAGELGSGGDRRGLSALFGRRPRRIASGGIYLDGGFGVGKTHLLAALWNGSTGPKAYLSFDELMYFIGMVGAAKATDSFAGHRLVAVDEWELDDPGNLKMALSFLRGVVQGGSFVAVTSNTLPLELGAGRFSQKDFRVEVEELASVFEVVRIEGTDYRHRHFEAVPGREYFGSPVELERAVSEAPPGSVEVDFLSLLDGLSALHPIRYRDLARRIELLIVREVRRIALLPDALRWVHFIDSVYDRGVPLLASGSIPLGELFPGGALEGPYGKKLSRCLSRMEELLGEGSAEVAPEVGRA
jgi:cell division protein ZapE